MSVKKPALGGFNVQIMVGTKGQMIDIGKMIWFYC